MGVTHSLVSHPCSFLRCLRCLLHSSGQQFQGKPFVWVSVALRDLSRPRSDIPFGYDFYDSTSHSKRITDTGFSRGAYQARVLAAMIGKVSTAGILEQCFHLITVQPDRIDMCRKRGTDSIVGVGRVLYLRWCSIVTYPFASAYDIYKDRDSSKLSMVR